MATEQGIVVQVGLNDRNIALVKTVQSSACEACSARHQCNPGDRGKEREVEAINSVNAKVGDLIQISMDTSALLKATFLLYVFPIICMLIGSFAGHVIGNNMNVGASMVSVLCGIASFVAAMLIVRYRAGHMALKQKYQPKITRIISRAKPEDPSLTPPHPCELQATVSS
ncbi:MAG: SoxR reducing system RseC family protein [Desulfobacteraceae bacterium]